tara:strand:- start:38 stop:733 length:696 start_codon:yes stop_codon:yes gene_type:complete
MSADASGICYGSRSFQIARSVFALKSMTSIVFGDRVVHANFREWGTGTVIKVENAYVKGESAVRITVRFNNVGLKKFIGDPIPLEVITDDHVMPGDGGRVRPAIAEVEDLEKSGLTQAVEQKLLDIMIAIPVACRDPFNSIEHRLRRTLDLYKFDMSGRGLMEWATYQTGMDDPLTRFNRTELEVYFKQFSEHREEHLSKLIQEARGDGLLLEKLIAKAPDNARRVVAKMT